MTDRQQGADFSTIVVPRTCGAITYTDEQLTHKAQNYLATNLPQGLREAPSHIMRVVVTPKGLLAHCRFWREGDTVVNPVGNLRGRVRRSSIGVLLAEFYGSLSHLGGRLYPLISDDANVAPALVEPDWKKLYETEVLDLREDYLAMHARALAAEAALKQAKEDSKYLLAELYSADLADEGGFFAWDGLLVDAGMTEDEMKIVRKLPTTEGDVHKLLALLRRVISD